MVTHINDQSINLKLVMVEIIVNPTQVYTTGKQFPGNVPQNNHHTLHRYRAILIILLLIVISGIIVGAKELTKITNTDNTTKTGASSSFASFPDTAENSGSKKILFINTLIEGKLLTQQLWDDLIKNRGKNISHVLFTYDVATGKKEIIKDIATSYVGGLVDEAEISSDGTKLYYLGIGKQGDEIHIIENSKNDTVIPFIKDGWYIPGEVVEHGASKERHCRWSPNNLSIACKLVKRTSDFKKIFKISVHEFGSDSINDIYTFPPIDEFKEPNTFPTFLGWADNENIVFFQAKDSKTPDKLMFTIHSKTGKRTDMGTYTLGNVPTFCPTNTVGEILQNNTIVLCYSDGVQNEDKRGMAVSSLQSTALNKVIKLDQYSISLYPSNNKNYVVWSDPSRTQKQTTIHLYDMRNATEQQITIDKSIIVKGYIEELNSFIMVPRENWPFSELHHMGLYNIDTKKEIEIGGQYIGFGYY